MSTKFKVFVAMYPTDADDESAIGLGIVADKTMANMSIADARELSNLLARAADDAEQKIEQQKSQTLDP